MRRTTLALIHCCLLLSGSTACVKTEDTASNAPAASSTSSPTVTNPKIASADVVRTRATEVEVAAGGSAEASVRLTITNGYHVNANPPSAPYLIPTELTVEPGDGLTAGKPVYPPSVTKKFAFDEKPLAVYEGEAVIKLPLRAASTAPKGARTLRAKLRVQACDDQACYPPRTVDVPIPVTVR